MICNKTKSLLLLLAFVFVQISVQAQCKAYFPFEENTTLTYSNFNRKGKLQSKATHTITNIEQMGSEEMKATVNAKTEDKKGREISDMSFDVYCRKNTLEMDMSSVLDPQMMKSIKDMEVTISGDNFKLPADLKVGQDIPDTKTTIKAAMNGFSVMTMTIEHLDKKVEAKESVTTEAGTFECYKITFKVALKTIMSKTQKMTVWYNEKVGMVKEEIYKKNGKLVSTQELTAYTIGE